jgi:hypothetical protein
MSSLGQMVLMGAIVATLLYWPLVVAVALALALLGIPYQPVATFGGTFSTWLGLIAWWLLAFAGACIYAACVYPWTDEMLAWPGEK